MGKSQFYGNEIERCPKCKEIWFDNNELKNAIKNMGYDTSEFMNKLQMLPKLNDSLAVCPVCINNHLDFYKWKETTLGYCEKCKGMIISHSKVNAINKTLSVTEKSEDIDWLDAIFNGLTSSIDHLIN